MVLEPPPPAPKQKNKKAQNSTATIHQQHKNVDKQFMSIDPSYIFVYKQV